MAITNNLKIHRTGVYLLSLLALTMVIVPLAAAALTVTTDKAEYVPGDTLVVSGTATPNSAVTIRVYNPGGTPQAFAQALTDGDGAYSANNVLVWPATATANMPYGTYRISAVDAGNGDTTEATVEFAESTAVPSTTTTSVSTTTVLLTVTRTNTATSTTTATTTSTSTSTRTMTSTATTTAITTATTTSRITTTRTSSTTNTVTNTVTAQAVTKTNTVTTEVTAQAVTKTNTVTATSSATVTQTSVVTTQVTETEQVGFSGAVTYAAVAVAVIAIIGAAVLTMKQRGML